MASMLLRTALAGHDPVMHNAATESSRIDTLIASALCTVGGERRGGVPPDDGRPPSNEGAAAAPCAHVASGSGGTMVGTAWRVAGVGIDPAISQGRRYNAAVAPEWSSAHQPRGPPRREAARSLCMELRRAYNRSRNVIPATKGIAHEV
jgi:hypothetical protein